MTNIRRVETLMRGHEARPFILPARRTGAWYRGPFLTTGHRMHGDAFPSWYDPAPFPRDQFWRYLTPWFKVFAEENQSNPNENLYSALNTRIQTRNIRLFVRRSSWTLEQTIPAPISDQFSYDLVTPEVLGGFRDESANGGGTSHVITNGGTRVPHGYGIPHFIADPQNVTGIAVDMDVRLILDNPAGNDDRSQARCVAAIACDLFWNTGQPMPAVGYWAAVGCAGFARVTNDWQRIGFNSYFPGSRPDMEVEELLNEYSSSLILADPPPGWVDEGGGTVQPSLKRWFPGHYIQATNATARSGIDTSKAALIASNPNFVGIQVSIWWGQTETTQGNYSALITQLNAIRTWAQANGKKVWLRLYERSFHGFSRPAAFPTYLTSDQWFADTASGAENVVAPKLWRADVRERFLLWSEAAAAYCAANPEFVLLSSEEWSIQGGWRLQPEYQTGEPLDFVWFEFARRVGAAAGDCLVHVNTGWSSWTKTVEQYKALSDQVIAYGAVLGPTDLRKDNEQFSATLATNFGSFMFNAPNASPPGYRGIAAYAINYEWPDYNSVESPAEHLRWAVDDLGVHFIGWDPDRDSGGTSRNWSWSQALAAVNNAGGRINTAVPSSINANGPPPVVGTNPFRQLSSPLPDRAHNALTTRSITLAAQPMLGSTVLAMGGSWRFGDPPVVIASAVDNFGVMTLVQVETGNNDNTFAFMARRENMPALGPGVDYTVTLNFQLPDTNRIAWAVGELRETLPTSFDSFASGAAGTGATSTAAAAIGGFSQPQVWAIGIGTGLATDVAPAAGWTPIVARDYGDVVPGEWAPALVIAARQVTNGSSQTFSFTHAASSGAAIAAAFRIAPFAAAGNSSGVAAGNLQTSIRLAAARSVSGQASANLITAPRLSATALGTATGAAALTTSIRLAGSASAAVVGAADPTFQTRTFLNAEGAVTAAAAAGLATQTLLMGAVTGSASGAADLTKPVPLEASGLVDSMSMATFDAANTGLIRMTVRGRRILMTAT